MCVGGGGEKWQVARTNLSMMDCSGFSEVVKSHQDLPVYDDLQQECVCVCVLGGGGLEAGV